MNKYRDLAYDLNKMWKIWATLNSVVISAQRTVQKCLEKGQEEQEIRKKIETVQTWA